MNVNRLVCYLCLGYYLRVKRKADDVLVPEHFYYYWLNWLILKLDVPDRSLRIVAPIAITLCGAFSEDGTLIQGNTKYKPIAS